MSALVDALRTEILYLDGNPDYSVPASTAAFLGEAADAIEELERRNWELNREITGLRRSWWEERP